MDEEEMAEKATLWQVAEAMQDWAADWLDLADVVSPITGDSERGWCSFEMSTVDRPARRYRITIKRVRKVPELGNEEKPE